MRVIKLTLGILVLVLPLVARAEVVIRAGGQQRQDNNAGQQRVNVEQYYEDQNVAGGQFDNIGEQAPPWEGTPPGERGDCNNLDGPDSMLSKLTVRAGDATYETCFGWDDYGNPSAVVNPAGFLTGFEYDLLGRLYQIHDASGEDTNYIYDADSRIGRLAMTNNFNPTNDQGGFAMEFSYDAIGNPLGSQVVGGIQTKAFYDPDFQKKSSVGPDGRLGSFSEYSGLSRIESTGIGEIGEQGEVSREGLGRVRYQYDAQGRVSAVSDGNMRWTTLRYDPFSRVQEVVKPDGSSVFLSYDDVNRLRWREVRARGGAVMQRMEYDYDDGDHLIEMRISRPGDAKVWKTTWAYEDNGLTVTETNFINNSEYGFSTHHYDALGRLVSSESPMAGTEAITYDANGQIETVTRNNELWRRYRHDALGRLEYTVDGLGNSVHNDFNGLGNLARIFRSGAEPIRFNYDINNRLIATQEGDVMSSFAYDAAGRLVSQVFGDLPAAENSYLTQNGLLDNTSFQGNVTLDVQEYDQNGQLRRWRDANGVNFTMDYDMMNRPILLTAEKQGGRQYLAWSYYNDGREKMRGVSVALPPDRFPEFRQGPSGGSIFSRAQQAVNRLLGRPTYNNRLKSVIYFAYDAAGNVVEENRWIQGRWLRTTTMYEAANDNMVATITYPSDYKMERRVDAAGRLVRVDGSYNQQRRGQVTYNYVANSPRLQNIRLGEVEERYTYDAAGRIIGLSVHKAPVGVQERQLAGVDYKYSPRGLLIAKKEQIFPAANQNLVKASTIGYDNAGRTISWSGVTAGQVDAVANNSTTAPEEATAIQRYFYDPRNNRTKFSVRDSDGILTGGHLLKSFLYSMRDDGAPQIASQSSCSIAADGSFEECEANISPVDITFDPDDNGNLRSSRLGNVAGPNYVYNSLNQLVEVNDPVSRNRRIQYYYDGFGRVITREVRENQRIVADHQFIWDGDFLSEIREIVARNRSGEVTREVMISYLYGNSPSDVLASYDRRFTLYHHSHPDGSVFLLTSNGDASQWFRYSPFGETQVLDWTQNRETRRNLTDIKSLRLFGGSLIDPLTGFYFSGGWYDPIHEHNL